MSVHELNLAAVDEVPAFALAALRRWAVEKPLQIALRHRRHGQWKAWRWIDVLREVERAAAGLAQQGFVADGRLALCGAFEPSLLMLALAARSLGGHSVTISPQSTGEVLARQLHVGFAFVQRREDISQWRQSGVALHGPLQVFCAQAGAVTDGHWQVLPLATLFAGDAPQPQRIGGSSLAAEPVVWVDEGTEWAQGLNPVLSHWLEHGEGLAFPETTASASRDRREIAPTTLLLSAPRAQGLAAEIEGRLAPQGSWRRRLCDWTLQDPQRGVRRLIKGRVRQLFGFQRLVRIDTPITATSSGPLVWLLERAA